MIIRRKQNSNFTTIPNRPIQDDRLNFEALGLLVFLLSKPNNWQVNLAHLATRGDLGRDKSQGLMRCLIEAGYVVRQQRRTTKSNRFTQFEYVVYDEPQGKGASVSETDIKSNKTPQPENPVTELHLQKPNKTPQPCFPEPENQAVLVNTESNKPLRESSASNEACAAAPSGSSKVWKEGMELLQTHLSKPNRSIIGKWLKRTVTEDDKDKLLQIIRSAARAGTADPVAYIAKAMDREFPPPPDPQGFDAAVWQRNVQAAIKTKSWAAAWGPSPGSKGCLMPAVFITAQLLDALKARKIAA